MKFRRIVPVLLLLLIIAAWFTKPSLPDFNQFYRSEMATNGPPLIDYSDKFIYSTVDVNFYQPARLEPGSSLKAVSVRKESYLGLFGKFWKR